MEIRPDGILYLPEVGYRRMLFKAFGPGGWALMPRGDYQASEGFVYREYALYCQGRFVAQAYGEMAFDESKSGSRSVATALEGAKSNALVFVSTVVARCGSLWLVVC